MGYIEVFIASSTNNSRYCIVLISLSIDTSRYANSKLGNLLRLAFLLLGHHFDVQIDRMVFQIVVDSCVVVRLTRSVTASLITAQTNV